jgi:hypothetical protein
MLLSVILDQNDDDKHYVVYKDRKIYVSPSPIGNNPDIEVIINHKTHKGLLNIERVKSYDGYRDVYRHTIDSGSYAGYSIIIKTGFFITLEQFEKRFYPHYYKVEDGRTWRCPACSLDEAWEYSHLV